MANFAAFFLGLLLIASACGQPSDGSSGDERLDRDFQTAVASDREYDIYWLGREFEAGGLTYRGPLVSDFGNVIEGGGLRTEITLYSGNAWTLEEDRRSRLTKTNLDSIDVVVAGTPAELITHKGTTIPVNARRLVMKIGRTHIEITANGLIPLAPTDPQPNPLVDEATFLAAVENLRPYPE